MATADSYRREIEEIKIALDSSQGMYAAVKQKLLRALKLLDALNELETGRAVSSSLRFFLFGVDGLIVFSGLFLDLRCRAGDVPGL